MAKILKNVRISFPSLFKTSVFQGQDLEKYEVTALLSKDDPAHMEFVKEIQADFAKKLKDELKLKSLPEDKQSLKDGANSGREELENYWTFKMSSKKRPLVVDRDKSPLTEADGKIYAGCRCNIAYSTWAMNNNYGKRLLGQLDAVQFFGDDEPLGSSSVSADIFGDDDGSDPFA
jgi:hypothetical protein